MKRLMCWTICLAMLLSFVLCAAASEGLEPVKFGVLAPLTGTNAEYGKAFDVGTITAAASLLTPYFWYINLGLLFVALLHPHPRYYLISRKYRRRWLIPFLLFCLVTGAIAYLCLKSDTLRSSLLGFSALNFNIASNLKVLFYSYLRIEPSVVDGQITPIMDFSALILIFLELAKSFHSLDRKSVV